MKVQSEFIRKLASSDKRADGRRLDEFRKIEVTDRPVDKAEGSAMVKIGRTKVIAGVKLDIGEPFSDRPDEGVLMSNAEFSPISSPDFEPGPPSVESVELARVVDRGIRESGAIDVKNLCIKKGEKVWMVYVDINILDHFGNLIDAATLAAAAALNNAVFPGLDKEGNVDYVGPKSKKNLPVKYRPVSCTFWKVDGKLILDPTRDEERAATARLTVATRDDGNLCAIQKGGDEGFTTDEVVRAAEISVKTGKELRKLIK